MSAISGRAIRLMSVIVVLAVASLVMWCHAPDPDEHECPHYGVHILGGSSSSDTFSVSGLLTNIPEYNDCQRFIVNNGGKLEYGAVEAIFVRYNIQAVYQAHPAAVPWREEIAEVVSKGPYQLLGIDKGYNCLVLEYVVVDKPHYEATMLPVGQNEVECAPSRVGRLNLKNGTPLNVRLTPPDKSVGQETDPIPPVVRWDWDDANKLQYIGIACPRAWCEVYADPPKATAPGATFQPSPEYKAPPGITGHARDVLEVKGWSDHQILEDPYSGTSPQVSKEPVVGTVFPAPGLNGRTIGDYKTPPPGSGGWLDAAAVALDKRSGAYEQKYNLVQNDAPAMVDSDRNLVQLCFASFASLASHCDGPLPVAKCAFNPEFWDLSNWGVWFARIKSKDKPPLVTCVKYIQGPPGVRVPGVVRWRWTLRDETIWISCPNGCCQVRKQT